MSERIAPGSSGPSVDRHGNAVIDPTKNVLQLVEAQVKRIDDLQKVNDQLIKLRDRRQDDLRNMQAKHLQEISQVRAEYEQKLRIAETARIDAIRAVDVAAVRSEAEVANTRATTLAAQVQSTAEAFRAQMASAIAPLVTSIESLRQAQYQQQGAKDQSTEGRGINQWAIGVALVIAVYLLDHGGTLFGVAK